jgi:1,4-dihydroxy-2-naphthoate octaprenyltransferase
MTASGRTLGSPGMVGTMSRLRGIWLELRVIPVLLWSFSAITLGTALAADGRTLHGWYYLGAVTLGLLIQGLVAHCVNELEDWRSGTDRHDSPRVISGGSKVLVAGLLTDRAVTRLFWAALALTTVLGLTMVASRGLVMLPFGLAGVAGAIAYTMPPLRAAYHPIVGELVAFTCLALCVSGAAVLQGGPVDGATLAASVAVAAYAVGMLMVHHYLDYAADRAAHPQKRTSIVALGLAAGRHYAIAWCVLATAAAAVVAWERPAVLPLVAAYAVGLVAHVRCEPADVGSVTRSELAIIFAGISGALVSSALLVPALAWGALAAAMLVAAELRLAVSPAERTAQ